MTERTTLEIIAPTVEEALAQGLSQLGLPANAVSVEVLDSGNKGLFGLGGRQVRVRLTVHGPGDELKTSSPAPKVEESRRAPRMDRSRSEQKQPSLAERHLNDTLKPAPLKGALNTTGSSTGTWPRNASSREGRSEQKPSTGPAPRRGTPRPPREERPRAPVERREPQIQQHIATAEDSERSLMAAPETVEETHEGHDALLDQTEATISKLLFHMGMQAQISAHYGEAREDKRPIMVDIRGTDLGILIGRRGETLAAFQYLSALIVGKASGQFVRLVVDVEGHRDRRERQLRQLARRMAEQVLKTGRKLTLEPMPASERRIIHLELRDHPAVTTESFGEEPHRKITIIPKE